MERRAWLVPCSLLVVGAACLSPGEPFLAPMDGVPPALVASKTVPRPGAADATHPASRPIVLVFTEAMDARSLASGVSLFQGDAERPIALRTPPLEDQSVHDRAQDPDREYQVDVSVAVDAGAALVAGSDYRLELSTLVTDTQGNALAEPVTIRFRATR